MAWYVARRNEENKIVGKRNRLIETFTVFGNVSHFRCQSSQILNFCPQLQEFFLALQKTRDSLDGRSMPRFEQPCEICLRSRSSRSVLVETSETILLQRGEFVPEMVEGFRWQLRIPYWPSSTEIASSPSEVRT